MHRRLLLEAGKTADEKEHETDEKRDRVERGRAEKEEGEEQGDGTAGGDTEWAAVDDTEAVMA